MRVELMRPTVRQGSAPHAQSVLRPVKEEKQKGGSIIKIVQVY
jgi:hypothetical protein